MDGNEEINVVSSSQNPKTICCTPIFNTEFVKMVSKELFDIQCFPRLSEMTWVSLKYCLESLAISPLTLFTLFQEFLISQSPEIIPILSKYLKKFPDHTLDFSKFLFMVLESGAVAPMTTPYFLSIINIELFAEEAPYWDRESIQIALIHIFLRVLSYEKLGESRFFCISAFDNLLSCLKLQTKRVDEISSIFVSNLGDLKPSDLIEFVDIFPIPAKGAVVAESLFRHLMLAFCPRDDSETVLKDISPSFIPVLKSYFLEEGNLEISLLLIALLDRYCQAVVLTSPNKAKELLIEISNSEFKWKAKIEDTFRHKERVQHLQQHVKFLLPALEK